MTHQVLLIDASGPAASNGSTPIADAPSSLQLPSLLVANELLDLKIEQKSLLFDAVTNGAKDVMPIQLNAASSTIPLIDSPLSPFDINSSSVACLLDEINDMPCLEPIRESELTRNLRCDKVSQSG